MFVNMTPHTINVFDRNGDHVVDIPVSGKVARCSQSERHVTEIDGVEITRQFFGEVEGLPEPKEGTWFVVSRMVAEAAGLSRADLLVPGPLVRNKDGQPIGCRGLSRI